MNSHLLSFTAICVLVAGCSLNEESPSPPPQESPAVQNLPRADAPAAGQKLDQTHSESRRLMHNPASDMAREQSLTTAAVAPCCYPGYPAYPMDNRETYAHLDDNPIHLTREQPVSTFSIDVDSGSYANIRRFLNSGALPPRDAVRVEELINYFNYDYPAPGGRDRPFSVSTIVAPAPWNADKLLLQVGLKGYEIPAERRAPANLVFLVDVSGSMQSSDKLPLLKSAFRLLTRQMKATDRIALVVYAGAAGTVLAPTPGNEQARISAALDQLEAGGSTNGAGGIRLAYDLARQSFIKGGINRIVLATDGDFNVGTTDFDALIDIVAREREGGVSLTTLGFGSGNYNDQLLERLADAGNGNHAYIDTLSEGRKVLVEQLSGTLQTIAKDVKVQVEFNPAAVAEYRLIGYENRILRREDFNNDRIDAGEIGAGHTVTALYELTLVGSPGRMIDPLRYGEPVARRTSTVAELANVRLRYKMPAGGPSRLIEQAVHRADIERPRNAEDGHRPGADDLLRDLHFAAAVAAFGQKLKGGDYLGDFSYADITRLAASARGADANGYRGEFLSLVKLADSLSVAVSGPGAEPDTAGGPERPESFQTPQVRR